MAKVKTERFVTQINATASLPVGSADFVEVSEVVTPNPEMQSVAYKRLSGNLGNTASYVDKCDVVMNETFVHLAREQNAAGDALSTLPEYDALLKISGLEVDSTAETLVLSSVVGISVGDTLTGDTSSASGTVVYIDSTASTVLVGGVTGGPFTVGGEDLNTATYTATSAGYSPYYKNTQSPIKGSMAMHIDDNKYSLTNTVVGNTTFTFETGKAVNLSTALQGFYDKTANNELSVSDTNPTVTLNTEDLMFSQCSDVFTINGTALNPNTVTIAMGAEISKFIGMGAKDFTLDDYSIEITAMFQPDNSDYNTATRNALNETTQALKLKVNTTSTGALQNGKSLEIIIPAAKVQAPSDSNTDKKVERTLSWKIEGSLTQILIRHGFFS